MWIRIPSQKQISADFLGLIIGFKKPISKTPKILLDPDYLKAIDAATAVVFKGQKLSREESGMIANMTLKILDALGH